MRKIDCESFIRGAEEIDRKRAVIKRVTGTVLALYNEKNEIARQRWKHGDRVIEFGIGEISFEVTYYKKREFGCSILKGESILWWVGDGGIPAWVVPIVYDNLSEIVEMADKTFPEAGVCSHFEFFSKQAGS